MLFWFGNVRGVITKQFTPAIAVAVSSMPKRSRIAGNALSRLAAMALRRAFHSSSLFGAVGLGGVAALGTVAARAVRVARC